jgi:hypothetical protein
MDFLTVLLFGALLGAVAFSLAVYAGVRVNPEYRRLRKAGKGRVSAVLSVVGGGGGGGPQEPN